MPSATQPEELHESLFPLPLHQPLDSEEAGVQGHRHVGKGDECAPEALTEEPHAHPRPRQPGRLSSPRDRPAPLLLRVVGARVDRRPFSDPAGPHVPVGGAHHPDVMLKDVEVLVGDRSAARPHLVVAGLDRNEDHRGIGESVTGEPGRNVRAADVLPKQRVEGLRQQLSFGRDVERELRGHHVEALVVVHLHALDLPDNRLLFLVGEVPQEHDVRFRHIQPSPPLFNCLRAGPAGYR